MQDRTSKERHLQIEMKRRCLTATCTRERLELLSVGARAEKAEEALAHRTSPEGVVAVTSVTSLGSPDLAVTGRAHATTREARGDCHLRSSHTAVKLASTAVSSGLHMG